MPLSLCALVLAAGEGTRLRPITNGIPKPLCPVGNVALLDHALDRLARHGLAGPAEVAVNACYLADQVAAHVGARAHLSVEPGPPALGTAGAVAYLRDWIAGRAVLIGNSDAYLSPYDLAPLVEDWDGETVRVLCVPAGDRPAEFGDQRFAGYSLMPGPVAAELAYGQRAELVGDVWRPAERSGRLELVHYDGFYLDTGTPADFLAANLDAAGGSSLVSPDAIVEGDVQDSVIGAGARVLGSVTRSVVFPGAQVGADEHLVDAIRVGTDLTVQTAL